MDELAGKHGDYQVAKAEYASIKYVTKNGDYIALSIMWRHIWTDVITRLQPLTTEDPTQDPMLRWHLQRGVVT